MSSSSSNRKLYFTAGPAKIPSEVMEQAHKEFLNYNGLDISVMEMSHRSKEFNAIITETEENLRKLLKVPDNYTCLFMHGGAKSQFDAVPLNLCKELKTAKVDYLITGSWSKMAADEANKYTAQVIRQQSNLNKFTKQLAPNELQKHDDVAYRFYCDNETIHGVEFNYVPESSVPLVCDMTSNFLSRPIDISKFGIIFAGAQKNCGIAGLSICIVRKDLLDRQMSITPTLYSYKVIHDNRSLYNTPLTFAIYMANLCFKWALDRGGLEEMDRLSKLKSSLLYDLIDNSDGFYTNPVEKSSRSRMNVVFLLSNKDLETAFFEGAKAAGLNELKGHRSVGGFRASLYNGIKLEDVQRLVAFMKNFKDEHTKRV